ncbi:MAG: M67 family metallopeptidase [Rhodospirillaceae bacterium]|nr:M67 family metallopeptidase [Rhodospirillaceae bacterium]
MMGEAKVFCAEAAWRALGDHAASAWPCEACGLLLGQRDAEGIQIRRAVPVANVAAFPESFFELDPVVHLRVQRQLREDKSRDVILGHYHSHPDAATSPSVFDVERADEAGLVWLISAVDRSGVRAVGAFLSASGPSLHEVPLHLDRKE